MLMGVKLSVQDLIGDGSRKEREMLEFTTFTNIYLLCCYCGGDPGLGWALRLGNVNNFHQPSNQLVLLVIFYPEKKEQVCNS